MISHSPVGSSVTMQRGGRGGGGRAVGAGAKKEEGLRGGGGGGGGGEVPSCVVVKGREVFVTVRATPGAARSQVTAMDGEALAVQLAAQARDGTARGKVTKLHSPFYLTIFGTVERTGEANEALVEFLAEATGVKKRQLSLVRGARSRDKIVLIQLEDADSVSSLVDSLRRSLPL
jgi:uncharacterized protein YggU (UPF0235/DUF167 family)